MSDWFRILNTKIDVSGVELEECWEKFETQFQKSDIYIEIVKEADLCYGIQKFPIEKRIEGCFKCDNSILMMEDKWKKIKIYSNTEEMNSIQTLILLTIYSFAANKCMIQVHSSLIDYRGHGLMFLGPSGIGKTTQAELWNQYRNALIINGDIVFVQETEESFLGWGTPWHGSSPYCENTNVPVEALIILKQAPENSIRKLEGFEKVTAVSNSVFYPRWLENGMELCLETLDHLLSKIPVYELSCRPDEEAVELTEKTIFGREH